MKKRNILVVRHVCTCVSPRHEPRRTCVVGVSRRFNENVRHVLIKIVLAAENSVATDEIVPISDLQQTRRRQYPLDLQPLRVYTRVFNFGSSALFVIAAECFSVTFCLP